MVGEQRGRLPFLFRWLTQKLPSRIVLSEKLNEAREDAIIRNPLSAAAQDWWTPGGSKRILSGDRYVKEIEATTSVVQ